MTPSSRSAAVVASFLGLLTFLGALSVFAASSWALTDGQALRYVDRRTGIAFSFDDDLDCVYDDLETGVFVSGRLSQRNADRVRGRVDARRIERVRSALPPSTGLPYGQLGAACRPRLVPFRPRAGMHVASGCDGSVFWYLLVAQNRTFWLVVRYPDTGGDPPSCQDDGAFLETRPVHR